jgi:hypothetical protein
VYQRDALLTDALATFAQSWVAGFRKEFGLDSSRQPSDLSAEEWGAAKALDGLAAKIVSASRSLDRSHGDLGGVLDTLQENGIDLQQNRFFTQALEAHLAGDLEDEINRMRLRALKLVRNLMEVESERARAYMARVGRCYLRGFVTETIVMCGAVLDAALQETLNDPDVRARVRCGRHVSLGNRIEFLAVTGRWDSATVEIAYRLADDRNNPIHTAPELVRDVDDVLSDLLFVLCRVPNPSNGHGA